MALSPEVLARLRGKHQALNARPSIFIDNKTVNRSVFRILPLFNTDGQPFVEYIDIWSESEKVGSTSPLTFGHACPINDYLASARDSMGKEDYKALRDIMRLGHKYVFAVIDRADPGTAEAPIIKLFAAPQSIADQVLNYMTADEQGDDVTDYEAGRDVTITKTGQKLDTEWYTKFADRSPLSDDPEYIAKVAEIMSSYDILSKVYKVNWANIGKIYTAVTGDVVPPSYMEGTEAISRGGDEEEAAPAATTPAPARPAPARPAAPAARPAPAPAARPAPAKPAAAAPARPAPAAAPAKPAGAVRRPAPPAPAPEPAAPEGNEDGVIVGTTRVSFVSTGEDNQPYTLEGVITKDKEVVDNAEVYEVTDDNGEKWNMGLTDMTILDTPAAEPEPEPAPAPAPAPAKPRTPSKPAPAAAPAKPAAPKAPAKPQPVGARMAARKP